MLILLVILMYIGANKKWKIGNIQIEELEIVNRINEKTGKMLGKISNIVGIKGEIEEVTATMDMTKVDLVADENGVQIPVPKGYVLSGAWGENDVTKGAVIYEGEEAVNDDNKADERLSRNQWVWIPVKDVNDMYREDSYGRKYERLYEWTTSGRKEIDGVKSPTTSYGVKGPTIVKEEDIELNLQRYFNGYSRDKLYEKLKEEFDETIESIKIYGGFYIGRYETGNIKQRKPVILQYNTELTGITWYEMYEKLHYLGKGTNVKTNLIYGSLFDETISVISQRVYGMSAKVLGDYAVSWGNFHASSFSYDKTPTSSSIEKPDTLSIEIPTGCWRSGINQFVFNISDLAGNNDDLTLDYMVNYNPGRVDRGANYFRSGSWLPFDIRDMTYPTSTGSAGRASLIII